MGELVSLDYSVIFGYIAGVLLLGLIFFRRQKSLREYFLASGDLPWWAVSLSLYATSLGPLSFLGICGLIFINDTRYVFASPVINIVTIILAIAIWVPIWGRLRMISIYEYLETRFHRGLRAFGAILFLVTMIIWVSNGLVAASQAFEAATGFKVEYCLYGIIILGTLYTVLGGARAVIWTDVAQTGVFMLALVVIGVLLLQYFDWEPTKIYEIASSVTSKNTGYPKTQLISSEFSLAIQATIWAIIFTRIVGALSWGSNQIRVQRLLAAGSKRNMVKSLFGLAGVDVAFMLLAVGVSWGLIAFYEQNLAVKGMVKEADQVIAFFVVDNVPILLRGLIMAGLLAAMMPTFDSALNSMSGVTINDFYRRYLARDRSEKHYVSASRLITLGWGIAILAFALWQLGHSESSVLERLGQLNLLVLPSITTFFVLGVFTKRCNTPGVVIGALAATALALCIGGFPVLMKPLVDLENFAIHWIWLEGFCIVLGLVVGYLASLLFRAPSAEQLKGLTLWSKKSKSA